MGRPVKLDLARDAAEMIENAGDATDFLKKFAQPSRLMAASMLLALISGVMLVGMGIFRLGFLANFLSHPVISGFITASGLLIAAGQIGHLLGVPAGE